MHKLLIATTAAVALASVSTAGAADLPMKAPPLPPPVVYSWTGCWISGGVGYGMWRQRHHDETATTLTQITQDIDTAGQGWLGRAGVGCDYQVAPYFVIGAFGDYDWMNLKGQYLVPVNGLIGEEKERNSWAAGVRVGYLPYPNLLTFISGGWTQARFNSFGLNTGPFLPALPTVFSVDEATYSGGFIGGGYEYRLPWFQSMTWKTEYRYNFYRAQDVAYLPLNLTGTMTHMEKDVQTVTTSLVWRFNFGGPVVARY
jgi:outer membrane immunogenic protein